MAAPLGHFFTVMTNGYGAMPDYYGAANAGGSLGDRRVHQGAAAEPGCEAERMRAPGAQIESLADIAGGGLAAIELCGRVDAAADRCLWHAEQPGQWDSGGCDPRRHRERRRDGRDK